MSQSNSIGNKGKYTTSSQVTEIRKQKVQAALYDANRIKTRGSIPLTEIRKFTPDLNVYSEITGSGLGGGVTPAADPPVTIEFDDRISPPVRSAFGGGRAWLYSLPYPTTEVIIQFTHLSTSRNILLDSTTFNFAADGSTLLVGGVPVSTSYSGSYRIATTTRYNSGTTVTLRTSSPISGSIDIVTV